MNNKVKLHLGCGAVYLPEYVNIDFPPNEHTVQSQTKVDKYTDITKLKFDSDSIKEIRLHHVFEHFDRPTALRLLVEWYDWLCDGGTLTIETPDFDRCIKAYLTSDMEARRIILRHLYGSHEAKWAVHYDGWYQAKFKNHLFALGFNNLKFRFSSWHGTYNIIVQAQKSEPFKSLAERKMLWKNFSV